MASVIPAITSAAPALLKGAQIISAASAVFGAISSVRTARTKRKTYEIESKMAELKARREGIAQMEKANQSLEEVRRLNSAIVARSFAGGVSAFSGSASLAQAVNNTEYGKDYSNALENIQIANSTGNMQSAQYLQAAKESTRQGWLNASTALTTGAMAYGQLGQLQT